MLNIQGKTSHLAEQDSFKLSSDNMQEGKQYFLDPSLHNMPPTKPNETHPLVW